MTFFASQRSEVGEAVLDAVRPAPERAAVRHFRQRRVKRLHAAGFPVSTLLRFNTPRAIEIHKRSFGVS